MRRESEMLWFLLGIIIGIVGVFLAFVGSFMWMARERDHIRERREH